MKTKDLHHNDGRLIGFSISNAFIDRHVVPIIVGKIPGVDIRRKQKLFALSAPDDFCEFAVEGKTFLAIEPFGDNDEYWIVSEPPEESTQLAEVRDAFTRHRGLLELFKA